MCCRNGRLRQQSNAQEETFGELQVSRFQRAAVRDPQVGGILGRTSISANRNELFQFLA